ncbi:hypothetical protein CLPUN_50410 [Clostridium puniceum]|uniref:TATA-box binding protein n=1 Tax=Clostridium puniceum TaxID=29367 RepID=A0A1S8T032_9CLOT|nr:hypothetical protein [Clostridium puniceum]OOM71049.1 hypothetical protein CLPUN_50410 [Clostridium puniceum]
MNIKVSIAIFVLLSFFNLGAVSNVTHGDRNSFDILENNIKTVSEFEENGVKLQYKTRENIEKEIFRIKKQLNSNINGDYTEINENQFQFLNDNFHIDIKTWDEDKYNYVEIKLINKDVRYSTLDLKNMLQKIEDEKSEDKQYFFYYKGKRAKEDSNYSINKLLNKNKVQKASLLEISNGYSGTGNLSNGDKINFALIKYNTGSNVIIGMPTIFELY